MNLRRRDLRGTMILKETLSRRWLLLEAEMAKTLERCGLRGGVHAYASAVIKGDWKRRTRGKWMAIVLKFMRLREGGGDTVCWHRCDGRIHVDGNFNTNLRTTVCQARDQSTSCTCLQEARRSQTSLAARDLAILRGYSENTWESTFPCVPRFFIFCIIAPAGKG